MGRGLLVRGGDNTFHGFEVIDRSMLERSEIFNEWYDRVGIVQALAGRFPIAGDLGVVTVNRARNEREFDDTDKARLGALVPHLQRAIEIQQRLSVAEQQTALSFDLLERLGLGILIVERECRVLFANAVARALLQTADALTTVQGCLRPSQIAQAGKFAKLVRQAALTSIGEDASSGGFIALRRPEGQLPVLITPYRAPVGVDGHIHGAALVMFSDPRTQTIAPEVAIAQMLGISPAEARLVSAVVTGQTMVDYAERVGISLNTAKTQMRQIFNKTGYNRQADVIRAVLGSPLVKFTNEGLVAARREAAE
jgi:DNA-binding CsgD family transcriptional regulator